MEQSKQWKISVPEGYEIGVWAESAEELNLPAGLTVVKLQGPTRMIEGRLVKKVAVVEDIKIVYAARIDADELLDLIGEARVLFDDDAVVVCA